MKIALSFMLLFMFSVVHAQQRKFIVAQDGSGDFTHLQEAIDILPAFPLQRIEIFIKNGVYKEKLIVPSWKTCVSFIGEDKDKTIITYDDYSGKGAINTFTSYTLLVQGNDFIAKNLTIENAAGVFKDVGRLVGQAVALHVEGDRAIFQNCKILGNQDTFYSGVEGHRQFFKNCYIEGTTDFIFGPGIVVFENSIIHSKKDSYITAASTPENQPFGFVFLNCDLTAAPKMSQVYLGRPWRPYAKTVFVHSTLGRHIIPEGWHNWNKQEAEKTTFYGEYLSKGKGANMESRVSWSHQLTEKMASEYSVDKILSGSDDWNYEIELSDI